jgi:N-acetylglucosaminyldiphosphoundecaprenol N-acetyl-beta-D-mannosaminyltransferase
MGEENLQKPAREAILGVQVSALSMAQALEQLGSWVSNREQHYVCVTGVHGVMESYDDPALRAIHNAAGMVTPDGMPLVWLLRAAGHRHVERVYGPDLLPAVLAAHRRRRSASSEQCLTSTALRLAHSMRRTSVSSKKYLH